MPPAISFDDACAAVERILRGTARCEMLAALSESGRAGGALPRLRDSMRSHVWRADGDRVSLARVAAACDERTRADGFHVLHDWDGKADRVNPEIIPVDVLDYLVDQRGAAGADRLCIAILLDYYLVHLLELFSLRIWDDGDPDRNLERVDGLLAQLQGPNGSGHRFAANAETLMLIATSHYEPHERGYEALLEKARTLNRAHRIRIALGHASSIGCHLRFGFEATYARDTVIMRDDNAADYPWLCFALSTLMAEYARMHDEEAGAEGRDEVVQALLNGLSADARAFVGEAPASLSAARSEIERRAFQERFRQYRSELKADFERHRPSTKIYSPLAFFFNFSHNIVKGTTVDALLRGRAEPLTLNDLLTGDPALPGAAAAPGPTGGSRAPGPAGDPGEAKRDLARTLMGYARANPDRIRGRLTPVIVYDPQSGQQAFSVTLQKIGE